MIFYKYTSKLLDHIDIVIEYHLSEIEIHVKWSLDSNVTKWKISYTDDECTLPSNIPSYYLCSSSKNSSLLNSTFYSYWLLLESTFYQRLFSRIVNDEDHFVLLICLSDGRIIALCESPKDSQATVWYSSSSLNSVTIIGLYYDLNRNLLDAVLCSTTNNPFSKSVFNHLILCESIGSIIVLNSINLSRILLDNFIKSPCVFLHNFIYITKNEIRSIAIANLLKPSNENIISQTKILRFGHFQKLIVDGQEMIIYYENGRNERLTNLLSNPLDLSHIQSLPNQTKKLARLTTTIINLQSHYNQLQRLFNKIELFYQINLSKNLKFVGNQWKLTLTEQQLRIFQLNDLDLILICYLPSKDIKIYQLIPTQDWIFRIPEKISNAFTCQSILILRHKNQFHLQLALQEIVLPFDEQLQEEQILVENYFTNNFKSFKVSYQSMQHYHLTVTIRNEAAKYFQKFNLNLPERLFIGRTDTISIEYKQQEMKVDTDAGLVDSFTIQIILSSSCVRRLLIAYSILTKLLYEKITMEEKNLVKQTDVLRLIDLIQETRMKLSMDFEEVPEDLLLNFLQIRVYLSMFRLGSNYSVQVY